MDELGKSVFSYCLQLQSVNIPDEIESIPAYTFEGCVSLKTIILPEKIKQVGDYAFSGCKNLQGVLNFPNIETIGAGAFCGCWSLDQIILGNTLNNVGNNALIFYSSFYQKDERPISQRKPIIIKYHGSLSLDTEERREVIRKQSEEERLHRQQESWRSSGECQYCGGEFKGVLFKTCSKCGKSKDY